MKSLIFKSLAFLSLTASGFSFEEGADMNELGLEQQELVLYYRPTCPFCVKVFNAVQLRELNVILKDISQDPVALEELRQIGGKAQVPCLFIDGTPLYESNDIIAWFLKNKRS